MTRVDPAPAPAPVGPTLGLARPVARRLGTATALDAATSACGIALLATSAWLISRAAQRPSVVALGVAIVGVRFFAVTRAFCRYVQRLLAHDTALRSLRDQRIRIYRKLEDLAPAGLPAFRRGDLLARLVQDVDAVQDLLVRVIPPYGSAVMVGAMTVALSWYLLPAAGAVLTTGLLLSTLAIPSCTRHLAARRQRRREGARGDLAAHLVDLVEGSPELVAFGGLDAKLAQIADVDAELSRISFQSSRTAGAGAAMQTFVVGSVVWATLLVGVPAVRSGALAGVMLAVLVLLPLAALDLPSLPVSAQAFEGVRRSARRIFDVMETTALVRDPPAPRPVPAGPPRLTVRGLRARYGPGRPWALDRIDLDLEPGRRVGIVGRSGAGKSTLAAVLLRFLDYEEGTVTLSGEELAALAADDVRRVVGLASQEPHMFDTSLRENLLLARRDATEDELRTVLARVHLSEWIDGLPAGLDTRVGERGTRMSGGQRQRLGIARCLLARFPVLILDEPSEHIEDDMACALLAELTAPDPDTTVVLITHRLTGLETLDEILVLDQGRVIERGPHAQLLEQDGWYAHQCKLREGQKA